jgi:hypothetical protein
MNGYTPNRDRKTIKIQPGYDSTITESMPIPSSELSSDISSWITDEDEGIARKPNVFKRNGKMTTSEKKTTNDSDHHSYPKTQNNEVKYWERDNSSIQLNDSWEVIEGSMVIREVESSFKTDSMASRRNKKATHDISLDEPVKFLNDSPVNNRDVLDLPEQLEQLHNSRKSSESHTATFASAKALNYLKQEETKGNKSQKGTKLRDGPFEYDNPDSEEDDYDSEQEYSSHSNKVDQSHTGSQWAPSKAVKSVVPHDEDHIKPESSSVKTLLKTSSKETDQEGWIWSSDEKHAARTVIGKINDSQTSRHLDSLSTHTSPLLQSHSKLLNHKLHKVKKKHDNYVSQKQFKKFIASTKQNVISEKESSVKPQDRKRCKSPLNIVDKLVQDANHRLRNKQKYEHLGQDAPFASGYKQWNKNLRNETSRNKSVQPKTRTTRIRDSSSYTSETSQFSRPASINSNNSKNRNMSAQRVKDMIERFKEQEKLKQEILQRERQIKKMESYDADEIELKKNIHKKYLRTKYKEKNGHSRWERENSEEMVRNLYKRAAEKKTKFEKIREQNKIKEEEKIKQYFKPKVLDSCKSWERLKLIENKVSKREEMKEIKRRQKVDKAVSNQEQRFINDNKDTVYVRMQDDLEYRKERDRKRKQLKKLKDLHYKEYLKLMHDECSDEEYGKI